MQIIVQPGFVFDEEEKKCKESLLKSRKNLIQRVFLGNRMNARKVENPPENGILKPETWNNDSSYYV